MKYIWRGAAALVGVLALIVIGGVLYLKMAFPKVGPAPDVQVAATPERIERGRYLAHHVAVCIDCHSTRDWDHYAAPPLAGTEGMGGEVFPEEMGFPGTLVAPNITPSAISDWTDGEIVRTIVSGVNKHGDAMFPLMPYLSYAQFSEEDVFSIVAYIRTLAPIDHTPPRSSLNFPMNVIVRTIPKPYGAPQMPDRSDAVAYGRYLTTVAACADCHTPQVKGEPIEGMYLAGGFEFPLPTGTRVRSVNITPDMETGIGHWEREYFIGRFKQFASEDALAIPLENGYNTVMPWTMYAGMTEEDLGAIYDYLRTVTPVNHLVERFPE